MKNKKTTYSGIALIVFAVAAIALHITGVEIPNVDNPGSAVAVVIAGLTAVGLIGAQDGDA